MMPLHSTYEETLNQVISTSTKGVTVPELNRAMDLHRIPPVGAGALHNRLNFLEEHGFIEKAPEKRHLATVWVAANLQ